MKINLILLLADVLLYQIWSFIAAGPTPARFSEFLLMAFLFVNYFQFYFVVKKIRTTTRHDAELIALQEQNQLRQEQTFLIEERLKKARAFQEDTRKKLAIYQQYLETQEYEKATAYISQLTSDFQQERFHPICSDNLLNAILAHKQALAESHNIKVDYKILLPENSRILPSDLSSVFFNLMDNGIDGCTRCGATQPFIHLTAGFASDFISIQMTNSKDPKEVFNSKTTKKDAFAHGFGLSIIQDICEKNDGSCQWEDKGDVFESRVLLRYQG